ncbi:MAG: PQQ-binding-like beta-propeller repeat protein [Kiritimatiellia bacterium]|jgi:outer membrane protein assembly factor BamB|nr:PQQ-binding-like beta-propeller repeat protein [Kiritimatiellia bacterium]MDP6811297.1 PQQ-binding-like beta-propeller repeat protein [Kiritimatiellia bacterium]MDP7024089.1 PQQ-binding-like beta-propeller repeat protein [Kiritimatiellia bacterium]
MTTALCHAAPQGADWPHWRGLKGDGISTESGWRAEALSGGPKILWQAEVGKGYSAVSIQGGRAFTMGNIDDRDIVTCLDTATGKEVWRHSYACKAASYPGPRATPAVDGNNVYTFSRAGDVFCLDAMSGKVTWTRNIAAELKAEAPRWGFAGSPVISGEQLLLNAGPRGMALDKTTGRTIWHSGPGIGGYSVLVPCRLAGRPTLLMFGEKALLALNPATGKARWSHEWVTSYNINAADPMPVGDQVWISSGYGTGCALLDCAGARPRQVWKNKAVSAHFSSAVLHKGYIYAIDGNTKRKGKLVCLKPEDGTVAWSRELGFGSLILAGDRLIVLNEKGALTIVAASPGGYRELASADSLLPGICWTAPTLSRGKLYLRDDKGRVLCLNLN